MLQPELSAKEQGIMPLFRMAFRPLFLLPSMFSVVIVIGWLGIVFGQLRWHGKLAVNIWHGHEMTFGFAAAVVVGFLLTAAQTWTGVRSMRSWQLAISVLFWLVARIALALNANVWFALAVICQMLWWMMSISYLAFMVIKANNQRNLIFIPLLVMIMILDLTSLQAAVTGHLALASHLIYGAVLMIAAVVTIVGGRVIPFFSYRALALAPIVANNKLERALVSAMALLLVSFIVSFFVKIPLLLAILFGTTGALQIVRMANWHTAKTLTTPLLWSLHLAYFNMGLGFIAIAISYLTPEISFSSALHIISVGTIGTMIIAMMSRVSLGHTGRALQIDRWISTSFALLLAATLFRVSLPVLGWLNIGYLLAGACWSIGFSIYLVRYLPMLIAKRPDGHSG